MRSSYRPESLPQPQSYRTQSWDHLGLVAGRCEALGIAEVIEQATQHDPERRMVTAGQAVKAMGLNGLGLLTQPLDLVPHFFQHKPSSRLIAPGIHARHRHDDPLGRALDTLDAYGGTALSSLLAATAARRLGLTPPFAHRETTRFPGDGRSNRHEAPDAQVVHLTPGESRAHRPDLNHVRLELRVEHPAGIPGLRQPRRGHSSAASAFGQGIKDHMAQLHPTSGATSLVADSALESADTLQKLAEPPLPWLPRGPATVGAAHAVLAHADPQPMAPRREGSRFCVGSSTSGGGAQRWGLLYAAPRQPQAQRTVETPGRQQSAQEGRACKRLCRPAVACAAEAQQALTRFATGWQTTVLHDRPVCPTPPDGTRGRPGPGPPPAPMVSHIPGALASPRTDHRARVDPQRCFLLATHALDEAH